METDNAASIEAALRAYAGPNYAEPQKVAVARFDFDDFPEFEEFVTAFSAFQKESDGLEIARRERDTEYDSYLIGFIAYRRETPDEVEARVAGDRLKVIQRQQARRAEYERMKREFGDA